jgi:outer membrane protein
MKKTVLVAIGMLIMSTAFAQRFAYVDTDYILKNIPEYNSKQSQLDEVSVEWQGEIEARYTEIDRMYKEYQAEQILLTDEMKRKREEDIMAKEKDPKELQRQRFGFQGDLFRKRQQLVKPLQDKVYEAIKDVAKARGYAVIFDKASAMTMLYTNSKYDMSDDILEELGYSVEDISGKGGSSGGSSGGSESKGGSSTNESEEGDKPASRSEEPSKPK